MSRVLGSSRLSSSSSSYNSVAKKRKSQQEREGQARALILAKRRDSDGADILRSPDPAVAELEISWTFGERAEPEWKGKEPEGEVEEQEGKEKLE